MSFFWEIHIFRTYSVSLCGQGLTKHYHKLMTWHSIIRSKYGPLCFQKSNMASAKILTFLKQGFKMGSDTSGWHHSCYIILYLQWSRDGNKQKTCHLLYGPTLSPVSTTCNMTDQDKHMLGCFFYCGSWAAFMFCFLCVFGIIVCGFGVKSEIFNDFLPARQPLAHLTNPIS